jgi:hypothetical protein
VTRGQLLELGYSSQGVKHRVAKGRLHPVHRGVYAVGRPELTQLGIWMAAVLSCGSEAALSGESAAALWGIRPCTRGPTEVSVLGGAGCRRPGIVLRRRSALTSNDLTRHRGIPVTTPVPTLIDLASRLPDRALEAAINEADKLDLTEPETLRQELEALAWRPGLTALRRMLDRDTFLLTDSDLERRFLPIARRAGLPAP